MAKVTSNLLKNAFGSATQKGPKKGEGSGDTQHGELANSDTPKKTAKVKGASGAQKQAPGSPSGDFDLSRNGAEGSERSSAAKPKRVMDHSTKKILPPGDFDMSRNGAKEAPMDKVMRQAHQAKVSATRSWIEGTISSEEHDAKHRRANAVLRHAGKRP